MYSAVTSALVGTEYQDVKDRSDECCEHAVSKLPLITSVIVFADIISEANGQTSAEIGP